jgi:D-threonate/D-erythronate kinase
MPLVSTVPDFAQALPGTKCPSRVHILADDLAGACDAAAGFLRTGDQVRVWVDSRNLSSAAGCVEAFSTASRDLSPDEAAGKVYCAASALSNIPNALVFKKIDSVLRGHVAAELVAAHLALRTRAILLAPAFPVTGRTVCSGFLKIEDATGRYDPVCIRNLFPAEMQNAIAEIEHAGELAAAFQSGKTVLMCDAREQEDLDALVRAAMALPNLLYAGSAGLAQAIAGLYASAATSSNLPPRARTLLICGTAHPVTELQLKVLEGDRYSEVEILRVKCERRDADEIRALFDSFDPQALVLTGGDTALLALRALGVESLILEREFAPGIPWGVAQGGKADGRTVVTKSGGFGMSSTLHEILEALAGAE